MELEWVEGRVSDERTEEEVRQQLAQAIQRAIFTEPDPEREANRALFSREASDAVFEMLVALYWDASDD